jgi:hypothetical protein
LEYIILFCGYSAVIINLIAFLQHDRDKFLKLSIIGLTLYAINIGYAGGVTGMIITIVGIIISILSLSLKKEHRAFLIKLTPILGFVVFYLSERTMIDLLPAIGVTLASIAKLQENIMTMKTIQLFASFNWLYFGYLLSSLPSMLFDLCGLLALAISIYQIKFKILNNKK